jgi:hypothetical protein
MIQLVQNFMTTVIESCAVLSTLACCLFMAEKKAPDSQLVVGSSLQI